MKSSGTFACSVSVIKLFQESGRRDRITSPVAGSCRIKTSLPSKRYSEGRRTAWLLPFLNNFAVRAIMSSSTSVIYTRVYHKTSPRKSLEMGASQAFSRSAALNTRDDTSLLMEPERSGGPEENRLFFAVLRLSAPWCKGLVFWLRLRRTASFAVENAFSPCPFGVHPARPHGQL